MQHGAVVQGPPSPSPAARMQELVALFEGHGALAEPNLLAELAASPDGAVRVQAVLAGLAEVPFYFDAQLWRSLEEKQREAVSATPPPPPSLETERARKEAFRRAAAHIYDNERKSTGAEE